jgi:glycosyltransferase involved in cell wall biosynthesis
MRTIQARSQPEVCDQIVIRSDLSLMSDENGIRFRLLSRSDPLNAMPEPPFVSVVTPVYNGGRFLADAIESVLGQSHANFEHVILDNASTDDTAAVAAAYARRDGRVRVHRNERTLWVIDNWNRALERIAPESRYCKILHADDTLYPECLAKMVAVAERHPSVGLVGSLRRRGDGVECRGLPTGREVFRGADIARASLRRELFVLAPSSALVRADLVRARVPFYPRAYLHADLAVCLELLSACDFGFVPEVLSFSRTHADSITATVAERKQTLLREWLPMLRTYGPWFFAADELAALERGFLRRYYRLLVRGVVMGRGRDFLDYHLAGLRQARRLPGVIDLAAAAAAEAADSLAHPGKLVRFLRARRSN